MEVPPSTLRFLHYYTMILQRIRIIVGDAGFEPGTSAPEIWRATNEPPHLLYCRCSWKKGHQVISISGLRKPQHPVNFQRIQDFLAVCHVIEVGAIHKQLTLVCMCSHPFCPCRIIQIIVFCGQKDLQQNGGPLI